MELISSRCGRTVFTYCAIGISRNPPCHDWWGFLAADKALEYGTLSTCESEWLEETTEQLIKNKTVQEIRIQGKWKKWLKSQFSDWEEYAELELHLQKSLASYLEDFKEGVCAYSESVVLNFKGNNIYLLKLYKLKKSNPFSKELAKYLDFDIISVKCFDAEYL